MSPALKTMAHTHKHIVIRFENPFFFFAFLHRYVNRAVILKPFKGDCIHWRLHASVNSVWRDINNARDRLQETGTNKWPL